MNDDICIEICMGSSCFARGNKRLLADLERAIKKNGWEKEITLSGLRCQDNCSEGPIITLNGQTYKGLDAGAVLDIIAKLKDVPNGDRPYFSVRKNTRNLPEKG